MKRRAIPAFLAGALALAVGCNTGPGVPADFQFDKYGWGGPKLQYEVNPLTQVIRIDHGMLIHKDFRWSDSEFSFEFFDRRDLVWGFRLLDEVFRPVRVQDLRRTWVKQGKKWPLGENLPPDQMWKFDTVVDVEFVVDKKGTAYKVLDGVWYKKILDSGRRAVGLTGVHPVRIIPKQWNRLTVRIVAGKVTYWLNDRPGIGPLHVDPRANGRLGIFVRRGGPLYIRNVKLRRARRTPS